MDQNLRLIEIELFSYCNRKCEWCPNYLINRKQFNFLDDKIFKNIIQYLKENDYSNYITFSRYNEPFAIKEKFADYINYIHQELPKAKLISNTNGDYLTQNILSLIKLNELSIMDYDNKGIDYCKNKLINLNCIIDKIENNFIYAHFNDMKIIYYVNWQDNYIPGDRGGFLQNEKIQKQARIIPCFEPKYFIGINYDGTVSPCCNIRNDIELHKDFILGDLHNQSLSEILISNKRLEFINNCKNCNYTKNIPCRTCINTGGRYTREKGDIKYE